MSEYRVYIVYWKDQNLYRRFAYVKARSRDEAYNFTLQKLDKGCFVTAVYSGNLNQITPSSICLNFRNPAEYELF